MLKSKQLTKSEEFYSGTLTPTVSENYIITGSCPFSFPYGNRTVGVKRYWEARAQGAEITKLVSVPLYSLTRDLFQVGEIVELRDYAIDGTPVFYKIEQVQLKEDTAPPCLYLTLTNNELNVTDERTESHD